MTAPVPAATAAPTARLMASGDSNADAAIEMACAGGAAADVGTTTDSSAIANNSARIAASGACTARCFNRLEYIRGKTALYHRAVVHVLGIDAGGTKTVCLLADERGRVLAEARGGGANLQAAGELE